MQRIELVELIEGEIAKLSPEGKEAWETIELRVATRPLDRDTAEIMRIIEETGEPPEAGITIIIGEPGDTQEDEATIMTLFWLTLGLSLADTEELLKQELSKRSGKTHELRESFVVKAVQARHHFKGRQIDRDMTLQQALARLKEGS